MEDSANLKGVASNKQFNNLTGTCFESPNNTIKANRKMFIKIWLIIFVN